MFNVRQITQIALFALFVFGVTACASPTPTAVPPTAVPATKPPATIAPPTATTAPTAAPVATKVPTSAAERFDTMSLTELVAAPKAEGSVVAYAFTSRTATVEKEFEKAYPGIDMVPTDISLTEMIARIKAGQQVGIFKADVAYISDPPVVFGELVQKGMLQKYVPPAFANRVPAEF